jgi:DHA2 family methylenomycin A resistance protein-like MFS transporter
MSRRPGVPLIAGATAFTLAVLATSVVNVALPAIRRDLHGGVSDLQWVVNGYALLLASLLLSMGVLCDQRGARRVMIGGLTLFATGGALAAAAPTLGLLVVAQIVKGAGGAALIPASLAVVAQAYTDPRRQARAVAAISGVSAVATAAGPVVAGLLIDTIGWRAIFAIDVIGALGLLSLVLPRLDETPRAGARHLDLPGQVLAIVALAALTYGVIHSGIAGWASAATVGPLLLAVSAAALFVAVEHRSDAPMLPPTLLGVRAFNAAATCGLLVNFAFYGQLFVLSLYLQEVRGLSPLETGWVFFCLPAAAAISAAPAGRLAGHRGARLPGAVGCAIGASSMVVLAMTGTSSSLLFVVGGLILLGLGPGLAVPALTAGLVGGVPRGQAGIAAAGFTTGRQIGGLLGVAVLGTLVASGDFVSRMHITMALSAGALLLGAAIAAVFVTGRPSEAALAAVPADA